MRKAIPAARSRTRAVPAAKDIDEYLAGVPEPARSTLRKVRAAIRSVVPREAVEAISYGMPAFRYRGALVAFAAFSDHCSFFPMSVSIMEQFGQELKAYSTSKGTIRFPVDKPLPSPLIKSLVRARIAQNEERQRRRSA